MRCSSDENIRETLHLPHVPLWSLPVLLPSSPSVPFVLFASLLPLPSSSSVHGRTFPSAWSRVVVVPSFFLVPPSSGLRPLASSLGWKRL